MTARWHLGPVEDWHFWRVLVFSPEILVFLFFMITDPKTIPSGRVGRRVYAVAIGVLAVLLIAPQTTEFGSKVAVLGALAIVCAARPVLECSSRRPIRCYRPGRLAVARQAALASWCSVRGVLVLAGIPARSVPRPRSGPPTRPARSPSRSARRQGVAPVDRRTARQIAARRRRRSAGRVGRAAPARPRPRGRRGRRDAARGALAADPAGSGRPVIVPHYRVEASSVALEPGEGQAPPTVVARVAGTVELVTYEGSPPTARARRRPAASPGRSSSRREHGRYLIVRARGAAPAPAAAPVLARRASAASGCEDVAAQVGLDFRTARSASACRATTAAMMGGGLCWLDYDEDGWLDLFAVNSYSDADYARWQERGGLPRSALFHNVRGRFENVEPRLRRRPAAPRERLRGGGLQRRRPHRSLRHDGRLQRRDGRLRRAPLGSRGRHLHRGGTCRWHQHARLALRRSGRRRERRRAAGSLRRRLHGRRTRRSPARRGAFRRTTAASATSST